MLFTLSFKGSLVGHRTVSACLCCSDSQGSADSLVCCINFFYAAQIAFSLRLSFDFDMLSYLLDFLSSKKTIRLGTNNMATIT